MQLHESPWKCISLNPTPNYEYIKMYLTRQITVTIIVIYFNRFLSNGYAIKTNIALIFNGMYLRV